MFMITSSILVILDRYLVKSDWTTFTPRITRGYRPRLQTKAAYESSDDKIEVFGAYDQLEPMKLQHNDYHVKLYYFNKNYLTKLVGRSAVRTP